jgi:nucleoside 2-deoxyribosyltransferase
VGRTPRPVHKEQKQRGEQEAAQNGGEVAPDQSEAKMNIYLCCPVRGIDPEYRKAIEDQVKRLEDKGITVYYPARDTNQSDDTGYGICIDNLAAIRQAKMVYVIWDGKSQGVLFDLGMAFALGKPVVPVYDMFPPFTPGKSFANMVRDWSVLLS